MMRRLTYLFVVFFGIALVLPKPSVAQIGYNGGKGLTYVHSAWTLNAGYLLLSGHSRSYGKVGNFPVEKGGSTTIWDVSGRISLNYGLGRHFEIALSPTLYQDTNRGGTGISAPDDLFLSLKIGSFSSPGNSLAYGVMLSTRLPTGSEHNIPFETYSTENVALGVMTMLTYSRDPLYPEEGTSVHLNLGYWNHNDVGAELINGDSRSKPTSMSQELLYGVGVKLPKDKFDFAAELYGNFFIQRPPTSAFSREDYLYISPSITYKPYRWLGVRFGADFRITNSSDKSLFADQGGLLGRTLPNTQPNYPGWRVNMGTSFTLLPTNVYRRNERDILMQKAQTRRELFEQIIKEQRETEAAESELERIKAERIRAEKELERLRRILEGKSSEKNKENNGTEKKKKKDNNN
ncbi:MAG: hypothetical protein ACE5IR_17640 [bacterium]